ncbi:hypothetical protein CDAR_400892 [Caerostris darwini]|uniref:Uncharacterized protein n=1 Tax=Caerostris darwini TaxID=1538125 RepID=A0AAV4WGR6_9ARAC|nr:hypothetical protein CDAR_400893 [Caerostris darwini]GIY80520.1 hypothetical protein CDAR_400892 [Caerostris darwini]
MDSIAESDKTEEQNKEETALNVRVDPVDDAFIYDNAFALKECIHLRQAVAQASENFKTDISNPAFTTSLEALNKAKITLEAALAPFPGLTMFNLPESPATIDAAILREFYKRNEKNLPNYPPKGKNQSSPKHLVSKKNSATQSASSFNLPATVDSSATGKINFSISTSIPLEVALNVRVDPVDDAFIFDNAFALKECIHLRQAVAQASENFKTDISNPAFNTSLEALNKAKITLEAALAPFPGLTMFNLPESPATINAAILREFYKRNEKNLPNYPPKGKNQSSPKHLVSKKNSATQSASSFNVPATVDSSATGKINFSISTSIPLEVALNVRVDPVDDAFIFDNAVALKECIHLRQAVAQNSRSTAASMVAGDSGKLNIKPGNGAKAASKVIFALLSASREVVKAGFEISVLKFSEACQKQEHHRKSTIPEDLETENKISVFRRKKLKLSRIRTSGRKIGYSRKSQTIASKQKNITATDTQEVKEISDGTQDIPEMVAARAYSEKIEEISDSQSPSKVQAIMTSEIESQKPDHTQVQAAMADSDRVHEMKGCKNKKHKFQTLLDSRGETKMSDSQSPSKAQAIMHFETESQKSGRIVYFNSSI